MGKFIKYILSTFLVLFLAGCTGHEHTSSPLPSTPKSAAATTEKSDHNSLADLDHKIHASPSEGGIRSYFLKKGDLEFGSIDGEWKSFLSLHGEVSVEWKNIKKAVFIPVCNTESGKFVLYKNGKNIADGPCGPGQVISIAPPKPESAKTEVFSYKITDATKAEVALYLEKLPQ